MKASIFNLPNPQDSPVMNQSASGRMIIGMSKTVAQSFVDGNIECSLKVFQTVFQANLNFFLKELGLTNLEIAAANGKTERALNTQNKKYLKQYESILTVDIAEHIKVRDFVYTTVYSYSDKGCSFQTILQNAEKTFIGLRCYRIQDAVIALHIKLLIYQQHIWHHPHRVNSEKLYLVNPDKPLERTSLSEYYLRGMTIELARNN